MQVYACHATYDKYSDNAMIFFFAKVIFWDTYGVSLPANILWVM